MGIKPFDGRPTQRPVTPDLQPQSKHGFRSGMLQRFHGLFSRHDHNDQPAQNPGDIAWPDRPPPQSKRDWSVHPVSIGLPRQATLRRLNSEKKEHLTPVEPCAAERRATSTARPNKSISVARRTRASSTPPLYHPATLSTPIIPCTFEQIPNGQPGHHRHISEELLPIVQQSSFDDTPEDTDLRPPRPPSITSSAISQHHEFAELDEKALINAELDSKWILNLSMHFRDKSDREKFFVTYAETPTKWRRVTVSCDYRDAEAGSLEMDLKELQFQRDKSLQIYESIRDSLSEIQFYDTVTNLKLVTSDGRLHVHVTEDVNETIPYPPRSTVLHILNSDEYRIKEVSESELQFESHLSGFVYKVKHQDHVYIKKEIPGPDTVDEFLYEINALHALHGSRYVIQLEAIVIDDTRQFVKGLLIAYAERGAIVDLLYDLKGRIPLEDRLGWAKDAVAGLSEIHDEGYVQGDFTLSNIVVDAEGHAKIIDINRRGCPVGWEPPEIAVKIASHQRISMYIGEKSDLYQLGMTLWGLAADDDEPERHDPPVSVDTLPFEVPEDLKEIIRICLDPKPKNRKPARELLAMFSSTEVHTPQPLALFPDHLDFREPKRYIDPDNAVEREDIERFGQTQQSYSAIYSPASSQNRKSFTYPRSSSYNRGSETSEFERPRGRAPPRNIGHLHHHERRGWSTEEISIASEAEDEPQILSVSPRIGPQYDEIELDGKPFLIARNTFDEADLRCLSNDQHPTQPQTTLRDKSDDSSDAQNKPICDSQISAGSSSTTRDSSAILPSNTQGGSERQPEENQNAATDTTERATKATGPPSLSPDMRRTTGSISPQPPPSLTYADSGFHEPTDDDEPLPQPYQVLPMDIFDDRSKCPADPDTPNTSFPTAPGRGPTQHIPASFIPPSLERSDTSFRIPLSAPDGDDRGVNTPQPEPQPMSTVTETPPSPLRTGDTPRKTDLQDAYDASSTDISEATRTLAGTTARFGTAEDVPSIDSAEASI